MIELLLKRATERNERLSEEAITLIDSALEKVREAYKNDEKISLVLKNPWDVLIPVYQERVKLMPEWIKEAGEEREKIKNEMIENVNKKRKEQEEKERLGREWERRWEKKWRKQTPQKPDYLKIVRNAIVCKVLPTMILFFGLLYLTQI